MKRTYLAQLHALVLLLALPAAAHAGNIHRVSCDGHHSIGKALGQLKPGDTLFVRGVCVENLLIPEEVLNVVLDGGGHAQLKPLDPNVNTVDIRGRGVTLKGFTVTGGDRAIALQNGGAAILSGNIIEGALTFGVQVSRNTFVRILGNTIRNNGTDGINVRLGSGADIFDNIITGNRDGVNVDSTGAADVSGNHIFANTRDGVRLRDNSHVRFSEDPDNSTINVIELNANHGVDCARGGSISGNPVSFGAGNSAGNTSIATSCQVQAGVFP
jgi:hypothetical protein